MQPASACPVRTLRSMDVLNVVIGAAALLTGVAGAWYGLRSYQRARDARIHGRQADLRDELKRRIKGQYRLARALKSLNKDVPASIVNGDLSDLRDYLAGHKHEYKAPTRAQLEIVIASIDEALRALDAAQRPPRNDTAFLDHVQEIKCNQLRPALQTTLDNFNIVHHGLYVIEQEELSPRKQARLFSALGA